MYAFTSIDMIRFDNEQVLNLVANVCASGVIWRELFKNNLPTEFGCGILPCATKRLDEILAFFVPTTSHRPYQKITVFTTVSYQLYCKPPPKKISNIKNMNIINKYECKKIVNSYTK